MTPSPRVDRFGDTPVTRPRVAAVIASKGRPDVLRETIASLAGLGPSVWRLYLSVTDAAQDLPAVIPETPFPVEVVTRGRGLTSQRNAALDAIGADCAYVAFFDDDVEIHPSYLDNATAFLDRHPDTVAISGEMIADGGVSRAEAQTLVAQTTWHRRDPAFRHTGKHHILYGCNMVIRNASLQVERFDEALPLYSYAEDYEISIRLMRRGHVGRLANCVGVHLRAQTSRVSAKRLGYAHVANNWYFIKIGSCHLSFPRNYLRFGVTILAKPLATQLAAMVGHRVGYRTDGDPAGYVAGSLLALADIVRRRSTPGRILEL